MYPCVDSIVGLFQGLPSDQRLRRSRSNNSACLKVLGLAADADRSALRKRYSELVRKYHPDRNGGDRSHEAMLQRVIAAYQQLRQAPAFA